MDLGTTITRRISIRTYQPDPAPAELLNAALRAGEHAEALTRSEMKFLLCTDARMGKEVKGILGDYGKTIHAPHYMVLAAKECEGYLTDAGYRFEQMVLEATRQGLGTCWVGLLFKEATLRATLGLDASWRIMVLSPIGIPITNSMVNRVMRSLVGSTGRKPIAELFFWQRHGTALPGTVLSDAGLVQIMDATRWAPSWKNAQPWRFVLTCKEILCYKFKQQDREGKDYHRLDCGIAMCHLHFMAKEVGIQGRWEPGTFEVPGASEAEPIGKYILEKTVV